VLKNDYCPEPAGPGFVPSVTNTRLQFRQDLPVSNEPVARRVRCEPSPGFKPKTTNLIATPDMKTPTSATEPTAPIQPGDTAPSWAWRQPVSQSNVGAWGKETVLVVDDEPLVRQMVVHMLRQFGYRVLEASGTLEAQRLADTNEKIHLLVTDFAMPQTNGLELAHWFQAKCPEAKVLIATGSLCEFVNQALEQQRFAVLAKPFDGVQLGRMVRMVLDKP
jgi:CheY-like chemotaxis protein